MKNLLKLKKYLSICFIVFYSILGIACTCKYEPVFCKAASNNNTLIRAIVVDFPDPFLMEVIILDNINKEILDKNIHIYGNDGGLCAEQLNNFEINDTLILALGFILDYNGIDSWLLPGTCGPHFLRYENGNVVGETEDSHTEQTYGDFLKNISVCLDMVTSTNEIEKKLVINTYPNPVDHQITIEIKARKILELEIYNSLGLLVYSSMKHFDNIMQIETSGLSRGTFILVVNDGNTITTTKFIKT